MRLHLTQRSDLSLGQNYCTGTCLCDVASETRCVGQLSEGTILIIQAMAFITGLLGRTGDWDSALAYWACMRFDPEVDRRRRMARVWRMATSSHPMML